MQVQSSPPTGKFRVTLNGKHHIGSMTMDGICRLETELGFSLIHALQNPTKYWGFNTIATVLFVALSAENPRITKAHITHWMGLHLKEGGTLEEFITASQQAVFTGLSKNPETVMDANKKAMSGELPSIDDPDAPQQEEEAAAEPTPLEDAPAKKQRRSA